MDLQFLGTFWFLIVGAALFLFTALDGFDIGTGMLLPFFSKRPEAKVVAVHSIWPVWDGNELYGLIAGGALFAIFPAVFGVVLSGFYPFVILLLVCLMYRPVAFEVWFHNVQSRRLWQGIFALCSFGIIFLAGVVVGNTMAGIPLAPGPHGGAQFTGGLLGLLNPFSLLTGLLVAAACLVHGASWLLIKLQGEDQSDARAALGKAWTILVAILVTWALVFFITLPGAAEKPLVWVFAVLLVADLAVLRVLAGGAGEKRVFLLSTLAMGFLWATVGAYQYPVLIRASNDAAQTITILNAGSEVSTLQFLAVVTPIVLAVVAAYTIFVYRIFKGKVPKQSEY